MTQYFPGPHEVEIFYVEGGITHKQRLNCTLVSQGDVGDPFSAFTMQLRNSADITVQAAVDAYVVFLKTLFAATTNITIANLYEYAPNSYDKTFLSTYDINVVGTGAGAYNPNHQTMLTFTTQAGNNMRLTVLDDNATLSTRIPIRDASTQLQAMATYLVGSTNWIMARDGTYPIGRLNSVQGQNEALFKRRNR